MKCIAIVCFIFIVFMANTHLKRTSANKSERAFRNIIIFTSLLCATFPEKFESNHTTPHQQNHSPPIYYFSQHLRSNILSFNFRSVCFFWHSLPFSLSLSIPCYQPSIQLRLYFFTPFSSFSFDRIVLFIRPSYPFLCLVWPM